MPTTPAEPASTKVQDPSWDDLRILLAVCRAGSLSGAARDLGMDHSTVFRRVNAVETETGVRFFERLPRGYAMTGAGQAVLLRAERIEQEVRELGLEILGQDRALTGKIRVTSPEGIANDIMPRLIAEFCRKHPEISVEILGSNAPLDLANREAEIALRATSSPPDAAFGRKICSFRFAIFGAPEYLERKRGTPLADMDWCLFQGLANWLVPHVFESVAACEARAKLISPSTRAVLNGAAQGVGVALMPCYVGDADGRLQRVSAPLEDLKIDFWILTHPDLKETARVRVLMDFLYRRLRSDSDLFEGERPLAR